jgi:hypothetical protein
MIRKEGKKRIDGKKRKEKRMTIRKEGKGRKENGIMIRNRMKKGKDGR